METILAQLDFIRAAFEEIYPVFVFLDTLCHST